MQFKYFVAGKNDFNEDLSPIQFINRLIEIANSIIKYQGATASLNEIPLMAFPDSDPQAILAYYESQIQAKKSVVIPTQIKGTFDGNHLDNFINVARAFHLEAVETGASIEGYYEDKRLKEKFTFIVHPDLKQKETDKFYNEFIDRLSEITADYPPLNQ